MSKIKNLNIMKRIILSFCFITAALFTTSGQNKKAEREAAALVNYEKAVAALEAKDFVIVVDSYDAGGGTFETNTDESVFFSYEKEFVFIQGQIIAGNSNTNKLTVSDYKKDTDKKGNVRILMQLSGFFINAKVDISLRKGGNMADVFLTPTKGDTKRFSGAVIPTAESKYFKRSGVI
jgi:hypothetical protein